MRVAAAVLPARDAPVDPDPAPCDQRGPDHGLCPLRAPARPTPDQLRLAVAVWASLREGDAREPPRPRVARSKAHPWAYLLMPLSAAGVGGLTNALAVVLLFWPLQWRGVGPVGVQGVVPAQARLLASALVEAAISPILSAKELLARLDGREVTRHLFPALLRALPGLSRAQRLAFPVVHVAVRAALRRAARAAEVDAFVAGYLTARADVLVALFRRVGAREFQSLVRSGAYYGFWLGTAQMLLWVLYPARWTLPLGAAVAGTLANWIAVVRIFEPVRPVRLGPVTLQVCNDSMALGPMYKDRTARSCKLE